MRAIVVERLTLSTKIANQKQYCIPVGIADIRATIKDLKHAWVLISIICAFNIPVWPL